MPSARNRWLALAGTAILLAILSGPLLAAASPYTGMWKLILTTMPEGVDNAMFLVKINVKTGKGTALILATPIAKYENAVIDDVVVEDRKISFVISTGDKPIPMTLFAPEGEATPARLLGSCEYERKRLFARAERTTDFTIEKEKAETPMAGIEELRKSQMTGFSVERVALLKELIEKNPDLPIAYYARLDMVNALAAGGATDAEILAEVDRAVKIAERFDPTMKPIVLTQGLVAEVSGFKARIEALKKAGKAEEANATDDRLAKLEAAFEAEEVKASVQFDVKPFAGRKAKSDRVAVLELFTGSACPPCVAADIAFDALTLTYKPTDVVLLQYHLHIPADDPLTCKDGQQRSNYYEDFEGTPTLYVNGKMGPAIGGFNQAQGAAGYAKLLEALNPALETQPGAKLALTAQRQNDRIDIQTKFSELKSTGDNVRLRLLVIEELVRYQGPNGQRFHHHVVRGFAGGVQGMALKEAKGEHSTKISLAELTADVKDFVESFAKIKPFQESDRPLDLKKLKVVALIQNDKTKEIYQAAQVDLAPPK
jgi:hypothetical protein